MKKIILLVISILCISTSVFAQVNRSCEVYNNKNYNATIKHGYTKVQASNQGCATVAIEITGPQVTNKYYGKSFEVNVNALDESTYRKVSSTDISIHIKNFGTSGTGSGIITGLTPGTWYYISIDKASCE